MSTLNRKAWGDLTRHRARTLLAVFTLSIAIGDAAQIGEVRADPGHAGVGLPLELVVDDPGEAGAGSGAQEQRHPGVGVGAGAPP